MEKAVWDVCVIGGGPAGLTAALYCGRYKLSTLLLEKFSLGGQIMTTGLVENFPGVEKMEPQEWVESLHRQVQSLEDVRILQDVGVNVVFPQESLFSVETISSLDEKKEIQTAKCVIIATGAQPKKLGMPNEGRLTGRGVSYCATCDAPLFRDKKIVVIGGGDTALEEALYLRKFASSVTLVHRRNEFRAAGILQDRIAADANIHLRMESVALDVLGANRLEAVRLKNVRTKEEETLACDGVFIFVGYTPETEFVKDLIDLDPAGYITTDESMMSACVGVFAAGDCRQRPLNQIVTACSDGAVAAFSVHRYLEGLNNVPRA